MRAVTAAFTILIMAALSDIIGIVLITTGTSFITARSGTGIGAMAV
ncbi:hypothetical protein [Microvirga sp. Mcv34]|nr:hypothetical protein [Microvirga sp. Mcv34]